jgi:aminopeptidase N
MRIGFVSAITLVLAYVLFPVVSHGQSCKDRHEHSGTCHTLAWHQLKSSFPENMRSDTVDVLHYDIYIDFGASGQTTIHGECEVFFKAKQSNIQTLSLDLLQMNIDSVLQNGSALTYHYNDTLLILELQNLLQQDDELSVIVYYHGIPQGDPSGWGGFYQQGNYSYNLGVGFAAKPHNYGRVWHPCFDNFVERATYTITLKTANPRKGIANGILTNSTNTGTHTIQSWQLNQEIPTYLACIASAPYVEVSQTYSSPFFGTSVPISLFAEAGDTTALKNSFINLHGAIAAFEQGYGPYLWDKVGYHLVPFNSGAMEHATQIAYPKATATGNLAYQTLMAHELAHSWWGNLVTCRTAEDMWINEGMASYSESLFLEYINGYTSYLNNVKNNHKEVLHKAHIKDGGYFALHGVPHEITYGDHSYNKGADVAHTLRSYMGDAAFFSGLQSFLLSNAFNDVDAYDFMHHLNQHSGVDVTDFFNDWIFKPGFPAFYIDSLTAVPIGGGYFTISTHIRQKLKGTMDYFTHVPLDITFVKDDWTTITQTFDVSNPISVQEISLPFVPVFAYCNGGDKIGQAVTGVNDILTSPITRDLTYPMVRYTVNSLSDSALLRLEHFWVAPDPFKGSDMDWNYHISGERFWKLSGILPENFTGNMRLWYNGTSTSAGNLDNELVQISGFHEDSMVVLHRYSSADEWKVVTGASVTTLSSKTDGYGYFTLDTLKLGEYTFGWRKSTANASERLSQPIINIYPNPAQHQLTVRLTGFPSITQMALYDASGKMIERITLKEPLTVLDISVLPSGTYFIAPLEKLQLGSFIPFVKL